MRLTCLMVAGAVMRTAVMRAAVVRAPLVAVTGLGRAGVGGGLPGLPMTGLPLTVVPLIEVPVVVPATRVVSSVVTPVLSGMVTVVVMVVAGQGISGARERQEAPHDERQGAQQGESATDGGRGHAGGSRCSVDTMTHPGPSGATGEVIPARDDAKPGVAEGPRDMAPTTFGADRDPDVLTPVPPEMATRRPEWVPVFEAHETDLTPGS